MDYDSKTSDQYKNISNLEKYLSDKYKMTIMTINIRNSLGIRRNELPDESTMELIENILECAFKEDIFLKMFAVVNSGPALFLVIDKSYEIVKEISDKIADKYFLKDNIFINVIKYE